MLILSAEGRVGVDAAPRQHTFPLLIMATLKFQCPVYILKHLLMLPIIWREIQLRHPRASKITLWSWFT
jgi:hypothetical protein